MKLSSEKTGNSQRKGFILFPLAFCLVGYILIFAVLFSTVSQHIGMVSLVFDSTTPSFEGEGVNHLDFSSKPEEDDGTVALSEIAYPEEGDLYARIKIPTADIDCDLYYGDGKAQLKKGAGTYMGAFIPGYDRTTLIAGHNHTFFTTLHKIKEGDSIFIETSYGEYEYRVTGINITDHDDETAYDLLKKEENIILYTCYPFVLQGFYQERFFVYGEYVSGPMIDKSR
jgi:sortase A